MDITSETIINRELRSAQRKVGATFTYPEAIAAGIPRADLVRFERAGYLVRLGRGVYSFAERSVPQSDEPLVGATIHLGNEPHFVSWWAALAYHGLTEQMPFVVGIAVKKAHRDREVGGLRLHHVVLDERKWYGFELNARGISIATPEKAILDSLDKPDLAGGLHEVVKALGVGQYNSKALIDLAQRWPTEATVRRLGYLAEILDIAGSSSLKSRVSRRGPLTPLAVSESVGQPHNDWWIADNIGDQTIQRWARR